MSETPATRLFLLSPAHCGGRRAAMLLRQQSEMALARAMREGTLTIGDAFSFLSGLYFRGKLTYARAFGRHHGAIPASTWIITPTRGLVTPDHPVTADLLREFASVDVALADARYRGPLDRDLAALVPSLPADTPVVLLGSVATGKYADPLAAWLGDRLRYPTAFIGRGDMSRGGLLLRSAAAGLELEYAILRAGERPRGARPPRLERRRI